MRAWAVLVAADRFDAERLYQRDGIVLAGLTGGGVAVGDRVMLAMPAMADRTDPTPGVFALGTVSAIRHETLADADDLDLPWSVKDEVAISYGIRFFDRPRPLPQAVHLVTAGDVVRVDESEWATFADTSLAAVAAPAAVPASEARRTWLVSLDLPIEATSAAEAVRQFWTYVSDLGPRELPTFVSPADDELAIQAMVGGVEVNLDPEEDE